MRSEGGSGCLKVQELNPEQRAAVAISIVEPNIGGQEDWDIADVPEYDLTFPRYFGPALQEPIWNRTPEVLPTLQNIFSGELPLGSTEPARKGVGQFAALPDVISHSATDDASVKRRINDAKFQCPVSGCGSTFTRLFSLKGMSIH